MTNWIFRSCVHAVATSRVDGVSSGSRRAQSAQSAQSVPGVRFAEQTVETRRGPRGVLVVEPTLRFSLGKDDLKRLSAQEGMSQMDRDIAQAVKQRAGRVHAMLFRGKASGGEGSWDFDSLLDDETSGELGYHLVRTQLGTYRRLLAAGVLLNVHCDFSTRIAHPMQRGAERLVAELEANPGVVAAVDRWILQHLTFFFSLSAEKVLSTILPDKLPMFEQRLPHIRDMVATLPPESIA